MCVASLCLCSLSSARSFTSSRTRTAAVARPFLHVLTHVLQKIRLLDVALSAILADVRLEVFALLVPRDVFQQGRLVGEALVAGVALERLVGLVAT